MADLQPAALSLPFYTSVLTAAPMAMAVLDADLRYCWVNEAMGHLNGVTAQAHLGRTLHEVIPEIADDVLPLLKEAVRSRQAIRDVEVATGPVRGQPGRGLLWRMSLVPALVEQSGVPGLVVFVDDVTEQRDADLSRTQNAYRTERFAALAVAVSAAVTVEDVADIVHDLAGTALSASACGIALRDDKDVLRFAGQAASAAGGRWTPVDADADAPPAEVLRTGTPLFLPEPEALTGRWPHLQTLQQLTGDQSWALLPLTDEHGVIGVIAFAFPRRRQFWAEDRQYLTSIAGLTSQALQRAYAHRRDHSIAHTLQQVLLPARLPDIVGLQAASRYRAADNSADVGGDFYDLFRTGETVTAVIGDVCQGGLAAAMVGQARYLLRALATMQEPGPALHNLNRLLHDDNPAGRFLTVACLQLRLGPSPSVTVANGGHPPPLVVTADRTVREIGAYGTLLGAFPTVRLRQITEPLEPGSVLVLYTDGVTEAAGVAGRYGEQRLTTLLQTAPSLDPEALAGHILDDVTAFETHARDDIALLVLRIDQN